MKKAQSAMEYLMTYGWAILIVIIVAAALFALGVFNPSTYTGRAATGFGELQAPADWQYSGTTFTIVLRNGVGQDITVSNVSSTSCSEWTGSQPISPGSTYSFALTPCTEKSSGASFSEEVKVTYRVAGSTLDRVATGRLTGTAV
ncbi:MAG: hypothetical protein QXN71_02030 [Candidatus Aenigmatarchaeota archaeon]